MSWKNVGNWLKNNAGKGTALVGSLLTGNVPGAIAAGVSLVSSATGTDDPVKALESLQVDPQTMVKLKELYYQNEESVRQHVESMARIDLEEHQTTQKTIQSGDNASDEYVRRTRPQMARQSWMATIAYCLGCWVYQAFTDQSIFDVYIAGILSSPAWVYNGMRTGDKFALAKQGKLNQS